MFNKNGKFDPIQFAVKCAILDELMEEDNAKLKVNEPTDMDATIDEELKMDALLSLRDDLEMADIDIGEIETMDPYEIRDALEFSGIDPDEYDFNPDEL